MGADDARGGVPTLGHHRPCGCGMTRVWSWADVWAAPVDPRPAAAGPDGVEATGHTRIPRQLQQQCTSLRLDRLRPVKSWERLSVGHDTSGDPQLLLMGRTTVGRSRVS
jgi:hypothetical protein